MKETERADQRYSDCRKKQFEILCRIDDICRQFDINMFLHKDVALMAYYGWGLPDNIEIAIDAKDINRFIKKIREQEDIKIIGMFERYRYTAYNLRVYDPSTIYFNYKTFRDLGACGLHVTVQIIQHIPDHKTIARQINRTRDTYRRYIRNKYDGIDYHNFRRVKLFNKAGALLGDERFSKVLFRNLTRIYSGKTKKVVVGKTVFNSSMFSSYKEVNFGKRVFKVPDNTNRYFNKLYGKGWKKFKIGKYMETELMFKDAEHSWEEFMEYAGYLDFNEYFENVKALKRLRSAKYKDWVESYNNDKRIIERTHLRYALWQKYMPIKENILELWETNSISELRELMKPYLKELIRFEKMNMTIYFDKEIFKIAQLLLVINGRIRTAARISELIPPEHLEKIKIKDYEGNNV